MTSSPGTTTATSQVDLAARRAAEEFRRAAKASGALVYRPHPDNGYALQATAGQAPRDFHPRLWIDGECWVALGEHEHWYALPLGHAGRSGLAVVGPFADSGLRRSQRRHIGAAAKRATEEINRASVGDSHLREKVRWALELEGLAGACDVATLRRTVAAVRDLFVPSGPSARILTACLEQLDEVGEVEAGGALDRAVRLSALVALSDAHDAASPGMIGHADRVRRIATALAQALDLSPGHRNDIAVGSRLHDCGEAIAVGGVLDVPRIGDDERALLQHHPRIGAAMACAAGLSETVQAAIRAHHERWDGRGYPEGLAGEGIPLEGRIVAVGEVFDALVSPRPWRDAFPIATALDQLHDGAGSQFDPSVVGAFARAWPCLAGEPEFRRGGG